MKGLKVNDKEIPGKTADLQGGGDEAVLDASKELELLRSEMERTRGIFDSARLVVGHEFNRPLTAIQGYLELIEQRFEDVSGQKEKRYFSKIKGAVAEMEGLIESFVHMLRFESPGEKADDFDEVSIEEMAREVAAKYRDAGAEIEVRVQDGMPEILTRRSCLELVLDNLVSNAVKHGASDRPVEIEVEIRPERRGLGSGKLLFIRVIDHGAGIPEKNLKEVFDPFYRGRTGGGRVEGLGLGLALVRNVLNIMMGSINLDSRKGAGTVATVCVPVPEDRPGPFDRIG